QHLHRLSDTIRLLGLKADATSGELAEGMYAVLDANDLREARCRITLTPGPPEEDCGQGGSPGATTLITAVQLPDYPAWWYQKGISVVVTSFKQIGGDPTFGHKTGCYLPRILARREAAAKGAEDALWYTGENLLAESCFSNVFLVLDGVVYTPPRDTPVLGGVVRAVVLELCEKLDIPVHDDQPLTVKEMLAAVEIFLTSSCMGIRPVVRVERHAVGDEKPGVITKRIMAAYEELLDQQSRNRNNFAEGKVEEK
ncbi:MAG: aminotransferase class IV family protein, partial [Candidatus Hydrogenedentes bacterium]|nr:aminotransferase class IV family protein [Candidatus Hydrogenedentota bacterium]